MIMCDGVCSLLCLRRLSLGKGERGWGEEGDGMRAKGRDGNERGESSSWLWFSSMMSSFVTAE